MSDRRLRVTFYSDALYFGGAEMYLALLAEHLDRARFELSAVVPPDAGAGRLRRMLAAAGASVATLPRPGFASFRALPAMRQVLRQLGGEVLHVNLPSSYDAGVSAVALAAREAGYARVISTEHLPMIDRKYRKFPTKLFFSQWIDRAVVMTEQNRRFLIELHGMEPEKIRVIDNGVNDAPTPSAQERTALRASWGACDADLVVGNVASLTRRKGQHVLLEAMARLVPEGAAIPSWRLVVVGEGEERATLEAQASALGLSSRVVFAGGREDAARVIGAFDLFVLPSLVESMPLTLLEAMAASRATIGSAVYGIPEVIDDGVTGLLVPAGDVRELAHAIERLLRDGALRARMGEAGRRRFEARFHAARMTAQVAALYEGREPTEMVPSHPHLLHEVAR